MAFRVIMMKDIGYINATELCSSGGKDFNLWARNNIAKELIKSVSNKMNEVQACENLHHTFSELGVPLQHADGTSIPSVISPCRTVCTANKTEIDKLISGTYCHS